MKIDGGCHCGYITYSAEIDPEKVGICHCTDCQTLSGSAFRTSVPAARDAFSLSGGQLKIYVKTAESGAKRAQAFCPECGTPIYAAAATDPQVFNIRVGTARTRFCPRGQALPARLCPPYAHGYDQHGSAAALVMHAVPGNGRRLVAGGPVGRLRQGGVSARWAASSREGAVRNPHRTRRHRGSARPPRGGAPPSWA